MTQTPVSVVVVSQDRPDALRLCLTGLLRLNYDCFEIIVVADAAGVAVADDVSREIKTVLFEKTNISLARNVGVNAAGGDVVAFIDDDAVPEPLWLHHLIAPFSQSEVKATGGFVLGRNGISFQWQARMTFEDGTSVPFAVSEPSVHTGSKGRAIKTEGTNMAFRRETLAQMGGFDPRFAFYLDETDMNMRLAAQNAKTAIVPLAQVHHGFAESARRSVDRVPRTLFEIGASCAVFAMKHGSQSIAQTRRATRLSQRKRLLRAMIRGDLVPSDVRKLLATFDSGWDVGMKRPVASVQIDNAPPFKPVRPMAGKDVHTVISGRAYQRKRVLAEAARAASEGGQVSAYVLTLTSVFHRVQFHVDGYWLQTGGQFGRSIRASRIFQFWTFAQRVQNEADRVRSLREL